MEVQSTNVLCVINSPEKRFQLQEQEHCLAFHLHFHHKYSNMQQVVVICLDYGELQLSFSNNLQ